MAQQIAGAVPRVAFLEDVAQDFAVGGLFVAEVSQELVFDGFGVELRDELAWLVVCAASAQACLWVSQRLICFMVESEESLAYVVDNTRYQSRAADSTTGEGITADIDGRSDAFSGTVQFDDSIQSEAVLEWLPNLLAKTVAKCKT